MLPASFEFPLAKAEYLFSRNMDAGIGGDKRKFWQEIMGFNSPQAIRETILKVMSLDILQLQNENDFGQLYRAYIIIENKSGLTIRIRTVWIVLFNENIARFVTAIPAKKGG